MTGKQAPEVHDSIAERSLDEQYAKAIITEWMRGRDLTANPLTMEERKGRIKFVANQLGISLCSPGVSLQELEALGREMGVKEMTQEELAKEALLRNHNNSPKNPKERWQVHMMYGHSQIEMFDISFQDLERLSDDDLIEFFNYIRTAQRAQVPICRRQFLEKANTILYTNGKRTPEQRYQRILMAMEKNAVIMRYNTTIQTTIEGIRRQICSPLFSSKVVEAKTLNDVAIQAIDMSGSSLIVDIKGLRYLAPSEVRLDNLTDQELDEFFALIKQAQEFVDDEETKRLIGQLDKLTAHCCPVNF
jgi:hypothetical protein